MWVRVNQGPKCWAPNADPKGARRCAPRGVRDILIAVVDGLTGFPGRSRRPSHGPGSRPASLIRRAIHEFRQRQPPLRPSSGRSMPPSTLKAAEQHRPRSRTATWPKRSPVIAPGRRRASSEALRLLEPPPQPQRPIHTTNAIQGLECKNLACGSNPQGHIPNNDAAAKASSDPHRSLHRGDAIDA